MEGQYTYRIWKQIIPIPPYSVRESAHRTYRLFGLITAKHLGGRGVSECPSCGEPVPLYELVCPACEGNIGWEFDGVRCGCGGWIPHETETCERCGRVYSAWTFIASYVRQNYPPREDVLVSDVLGDPEFYGRSGEIAFSDGQKENFRVPIGDGSALHVKKYDDVYKAHIDENDPGRDPVGHLLETPKGAMLLTGVVAAGGLLAAEALSE